MEEHHPARERGSENMNRLCRNQGFTLVEMMVALVLTLMVFGMAVGVVVAGQNTMGGKSLEGEMQDNLRIGLNKIAHELMASGRNCPGFQIYTTGPVICDFRRCAGYDPVTMEVQWEPPVTARPLRMFFEEDTQDKEYGSERQLRIQDWDDAAGAVVEDAFVLNFVSAFKIEEDIDDDRKLTITLEMTRDDYRVKASGGGPTKRTQSRQQTIFLRN
jgi:prepilin-type N-terminal cleavage/methylation domain-containing protein